MRRLLLALALVLSGAAAEAQIVTEPPAPFTGGTLTSPLLGPDSCANPTYSFTSDPDSGLGSDGVGLCVADDFYFSVAINDGGGNLSNFTLSPADALVATTDGTSTQDFGINPFQGIFGVVDDGAGETSSFTLVPGGWDLEQVDATYSLDEERVNGDISITAEFLATGDNANLILNADSPLVRLQTTLGTDVAEIVTNSGDQIVLDADVDDSGDGQVILRTDLSGQQILLDLDSVDLLSNNEIDLTASTLVDINSTTQIDLGVGGTDTLVMGAHTATFTTASGAGDAYYLRLSDQVGAADVILHADAGGANETRIRQTGGSITIDGDFSNAGAGAVTIETDNSGQQVVLDSDNVGITSNASIDLDIGTTVAVDLTPDTVLIDADVDNDVDGTITLEAANSTSRVVVNSTGVSVTNYFYPQSLAFAALGAPSAGAVVFCSDCDLGSTPCASTPGPGTLAVYNGAAWNCQ